jgi:enoyl-CoA hydratase/carnithine racemase
MGFVQRVVPAAALDREVKAYCDMIAENAPLTLAATKRCIIEGLKDPAERDMQTVDQANKACFASEDYREGARAFMEKRPPQFQGR